jgi:phytoene synthase
VNRAELVSAAGETIRIGSRSFHMASRLFDRQTRERAWLLYSWCRHCDDQCDGQLLGHRADGARQCVADVEAETGRVLRGEQTGKLPFDALGQVLSECAIPHRYVLDHLGGFALDAEGWRPRTEADLIRYCYHVAGAVGCMMAIVMGVPAEDQATLERASDLGIAFQLSNIARDVRDDHEAGRCYLPGEWLEAHGLSREDPLRPDQREALVALVGRICDLAERYEHSARDGISRLPFRSRWAIHSAAGIYGRIGRRVAERGPEAWDARVVIPRREKALIMLSSLRSAI